MWYLGGKARQSKQIVAAIAELKPDFTTYVEPFCGAMWSACAVIREFPDRTYILNDINPYLIFMWQEALKGWNPPKTVTEKQYKWYQQNKPLNDPLTAYIGFALSFGGKFYGGAARNSKGEMNGSYSSTVQKLEVLRNAKVTITCGDYSKVKVPNKSMVYLDPTYNNRTKQAQIKGIGVDKNFYKAWAEKLARTNTVIATEFFVHKNWEILYNYGDTVVRHLNAKEPDGTNEYLMQVQT